MKERLKVWWQNWRNRHVAKAYRVMSEALRKDTAYYDTWHANIAMTIYDATRPKCHCEAITGLRPRCLTEHLPKCEIVEAAAIPRRFELQEMSIEQCHFITDRLMKHLFGRKP